MRAYIDSDIMISHPSHGVGIDDCILAAIALETGGTVRSGPEALPHAGTCGHEGMLAAVAIPDVYVGYKGTLSCALTPAPRMAGWSTGE